MIVIFLFFVVVAAGLVAFLYAVNWDSKRCVDAEFYVYYDRRKAKESLKS